MTVTAFHVIPFIFIFNTKCMHTVFIPKIVRLVFSPSCKVPSTTICPSKGALGENIIQSQPGFCSIVKMLKKHIFFVILDINKNRVFLSAFIQCCGPILTSLTCEIAKAVEIVPARFTDVCEIQINVSVKNIYIQINCRIDKSLAASHSQYC